MEKVEKQTCSQCRQRKVRCTGEPQACRNCRRLHFTCSYGDTVDAPTVRPLRGRQACLVCRSQKTKCSGSLPCCSKCRLRGTVCTYPAPKRRRFPSFHEGQLQPLPGADADADTGEQQRDELVRNSSTPGPTTPQASAHHSTDTNAAMAPPACSTLTVPFDSLRTSVQQYFSVYYPLPSYAFMHPSSTSLQCQEGTLNATLANAIHGLVSLQDNTADIDQTRVSSWIEQAEIDILTRLDRVSIARLQALLLITHYHMETGRLQKAFMLIAIATRFATAMRLNHEPSHPNVVQQEVRRRLLWSLKLIERYFSIGLMEFELCPFEAIYLRFPINEKDFIGAGHPTGEVVETPHDDLGSYRLSIKLEIIRRDIIKFSRCIALGDGGTDLFRELFHSFENQLAQVTDEFSSLSLADADTSPDCMLDPWLTRKAFLKLSLHQCHCDLWRLMLMNYPEAAPMQILQNVELDSRVQSEQHCWDNAMAIVRVITGLNERSTKTLVFEFDTAICIYHAIRIILFISTEGISPARAAPEFAVSRAHLCIAALRRFFPKSSLVQPIIDELQSLATRRTLPLPTSGQQLQERRASPEMSNNDGSSQLTGAAKAKQRLAIHSLLARSRFELDEGTRGTALDNSGIYMTPGNLSAVAQGSRPTFAHVDQSVTCSQAASRLDAANPTQELDAFVACDGDTPLSAQMDLAQFTLYPWLQH